MSFPVEYEAVVFKPFKNEVLDTKVTQVNKVRLGAGRRGIAGRRGGLCACEVAARVRATHTHRHCIHTLTLLRLTHASSQMGFFAEAGPLQVFVSSHLIPDDHQFTMAEEPSFQSDDGQSRIRVNCEVRLRIIGSRVDPGKIFCIGTMKDDYTGLVRDPTT